ncbi:phage tail tape measure protein [Trichonephila clavata]|uniref:Phage tail tape measure protein n=1 Tax=Trichonephila clavata TaxID=2740835 RepID=A0A8X6LHU1_TRICU|nr:phage tail tape measure protein [Trichonephila clavata]
MGLKALTLTNPIGAVVAGLSVGAALVIANWQKVKDLFSSIWKSIVKPIGEFFNWIGIGKLFNDSPLKAFETPVETKIGKVITESNVLSNENPLLNNKEISESGKSIIGNTKIGSVIEEKSSVADDLLRWHQRP